MKKLNLKDERPLYRQIIAMVEEDIRKGQLLPGDKLPAERKLAEELGVNRSTVVRAFDELMAMGVIERKQGSGTKIAEEQMGENIYDGLNWRKLIAQDQQGWMGEFREQILQRLKTSSHIIDGYSSELPVELIPEFDIGNLSWKKFVEEDQKKEELGNLALRKEIQKLSQTELDLAMTMDKTLITTGGQQAIFLIIHSLLNAGDSVAIESPSFFYSLPVFEAAKIKTEAIPMERDGMNLKVLEEKLKKGRIKLVFTNPSFQNPTGVTMSKAKRKKLTALCEEYQVPIVEDDVFGLLRFPDSPKLPKLKNLSPENVIYIGSLTKVLGATIQLGWVNAPLRVIEQMIHVRDNWEMGVSIFPQVIGLQALSDPFFIDKLNDLRNELVKRRNTFINYLEKEVGGDYTYDLPEGGYYIWLTNCKKELTLNDWKKMLEGNFLVMPGFLLKSSKQSFRVNFARYESQSN